MTHRPSLRLLAAVAASAGALLLASCASTSRQRLASVPYPDGTPRPLIIAEYRPITLDGDLADWEGVPFIDVTPQTGIFDGESQSTDCPKDLSYRFALCHDNDALYVAVRVVDDVLQLDDTAADETHAKAWMDDAIEVFIDGNLNRAPHARSADRAEYPSGGEFSLVANGAATSNCTGWPDSFGKPDYWQGATAIHPQADGSVVLTYEYRLTWRVMGGIAGPGSRIGFTIGVQDDDDGGNRDHALYWQGFSPSCWKDENGWGEVFIKPAK